MRDFSDGFKTENANPGVEAGPISRRNRRTLTEYRKAGFARCLRSERERERERGVKNANAIAIFPRGGKAPRVLCILGRYYFHIGTVVFS